MPKHRTNGPSGNPGLMSAYVSVAKPAKIKKKRGKLLLEKHSPIINYYQVCRRREKSGNTQAKDCGWAHFAWQPYCSYAPLHAKLQVMLALSICSTANTCRCGCLLLLLPLLQLLLPQKICAGQNRKTKRNCPAFGISQVVRRITGNWQQRESSQSVSQVASRLYKMDLLPTVELCALCPVCELYPVPSASPYYLLPAFPLLLL